MHYARNITLKNIGMINNKNILCLKFVNNLPFGIYN